MSRVPTVLARLLMPTGIAMAVSLATSPAMAGPLDGFFPSGGPFGSPRTAVQAGRLSSAQIVDILYTRYGTARVMTVRGMGDIYEVDAVDRQGRRVRYTVDAFDGALIDRAWMGAYEAPVPVPPGSVPIQRRAPVQGGPIYGEPPPDARSTYGVRPADPRRELEVVPPLQQPRRERQAVRPDPSAMPRPSVPYGTGTEPLPSAPSAPQQASPSPAIPAGPQIVPVEKKPLDPPGATATRTPPGQGVTRVPVAPAPVAPAPAAPTAVLPSAPSVAVPAAPSPAEPAQPRPPSVVKQATPQPATRIPEPLIDPKTGKPSAPASTSSVTPIVPVTPLDEVKRKGAETPSVPPALLN